MRSSGTEPAEESQPFLGSLAGSGARGASASSGSGVRGRGHGNEGGKEQDEQQQQQQEQQDGGQAKETALLHPDQTDPAPRMYAVINSLRGAAMVYVLMEHTLKAINHNQSWGEAVGMPLWLSSLLWPIGAQKSCGANGVAFFFVLSGAVAWLPCVDTPGGPTPRVIPSEEDGGIATYWLKRGGRILPMYFIVLVLFQNLQMYWGWQITDVDAAGDAANSLIWWSDWGLSMTLTSTFSKTYFYPAAYGVLWAIGPIYWFSVVFFPLFAVLLRPHTDRSRPLRSAFNAVSLAVAVSMVVRVATKVPSLGLQVDETQGAVSDSVLGRMDDFVVGMACSVWLRERVSVYHAASALFCGWLMVACFTYFIADAIILGFDYTTYQFTGLWWLYSAVLPPLRSVGYAMVVVGLHHSIQGAALTLPRFVFVSNHIMQAFGSMSYSVFVWHYPALGNTFAGGIANNWVGLHPNGWRLLFTYLFMIAPLVLLSYVHIEGGSLLGPYPQANDDLRFLLGSSPLARLVPVTPAQSPRGASGVRAAEYRKIGPE